MEGHPDQTIGICINRIFRQFLHAEAARIIASNGGRLLNEAEMTTRLGIADMEEVHGVTRDSLRKLLPAMGTPRTREVITSAEQAAINQALKNLLEAKAGVRDRTNYQRRILGEGIRDQSRLDLLSRGFIVSRNASKGGMRMYNIFQAQLLRLISGSRIIDRPTVAEYNQVGDVLYGVLETEVIRAQLLEWLSLAGLTPGNITRVEMRRLSDQIRLNLLAFAYALEGVSHKMSSDGLASVLNQHFQAQ